MEARRAQTSAGRGSVDESASPRTSRHPDIAASKGRYSQSSEQSQNASHFMRRIAGFGSGSIRAKGRDSGISMLSDISAPLPSTPPRASLPPILDVLTDLPAPPPIPSRSTIDGQVENVQSRPAGVLPTTPDPLSDRATPPRRPPRPISGLLFEYGDLGFNSSSPSQLHQLDSRQTETTDEPSRQSKPWHAGLRAESTLKALRRPPILDSMAIKLRRTRNDDAVGDKPRKLSMEKQTVSGQAMLKSKAEGAAEGNQSQAVSPALESSPRTPSSVLTTPVRFYSSADADDAQGSTVHKPLGEDSAGGKSFRKSTELLSSVPSFLSGRSAERMQSRINAAKRFRRGEDVDSPIQRTPPSTTPSLKTPSLQQPSLETAAVKTSPSSTPPSERPLRSSPLQAMSSPEESLLGTPSPETPSPTTSPLPVIQQKARSNAYTFRALPKIPKPGIVSLPATSIRMQLQSELLAIPELDPWHKTTYLHGPIRLTDPTIVRRNTIVATMEPFQDAVDKVFQDGESITKHKSELVMAEELCTFFMSFALGEYQSKGDLLAVGSASDSDGSIYSDETEDEDLSFQCAGKAFYTAPQWPTISQAPHQREMVVQAAPPLRNEEMLRTKGIDWLSRQRSRRTRPHSYLPIVSEPEDDMLGSVLAASADVITPVEDKPNLSEDIETH